MFKLLYTKISLLAGLSDVLFTGNHKLDTAMIDYKSKIGKAGKVWYISYKIKPNQ